MRKGQWILDTKGDVGQIVKKQGQKVWCRWLIFEDYEGWESQPPTWVEPEELTVIPKAVADIARKAVES